MSRDSLLVRNIFRLADKKLQTKTLTTGPTPEYYKTYVENISQQLNTITV